MDITTYTKKPRQLSGVYYDGTLSDAQSIQDWVQQTTGLNCVISQLGVPSETEPGEWVQWYNVYVPSPSGTNILLPGMYLLQDMNQAGIPIYYPISEDELARNYDEKSDSSDS